MQKILILALFLAADAALAQHDPAAVPRPVPPSNDRPYNLDHPRRPDAEGVLRPAPPEPGPDVPATAGDRFRLRENRDDLLLRERQSEERERRSLQDSLPAEHGTVRDFARYGLSPPPPDSVWQRSGADAVLIDQKTGVVESRKTGVFAVK